MDSKARRDLENFQREMLEYRNIMERRIKSLEWKVSCLEREVAEAIKLGQPNQVYGGADPRLRYFNKDD